MDAIRIATSDAERQSIYSFRYRVFSQHLGRRDLLGLDHARQILSDPLDPSSRHFYLGAFGDPFASVTVTPLDGAAVSRALSDFLALDRLGQAVDTKRTALVNWLLADPDRAGSTLVASLLVAVYERLLNDGVDLLLTFCRPGLVSFYERLGFEQYSYASDLEGIGLRCPLMLVLRDGARLKTFRSPFLRILIRNGGQDQADETRLRLEPIVDLFQASQILVNDELWVEGGVRFVERPVPKLFDGLGEGSIREIMKLASVITCRPDEVITRAGETSDDMFLIVSGSFSCARESHHDARQLGEGDLFGEREHLSGRPRAETVTANSQGHVAAIKAERLFQWMRLNPDDGVKLAINLARHLAGRLSA
jgi:hypothetical protein